MSRELTDEDVLVLATVPRNIHQRRAQQDGLAGDLTREGDPESIRGRMRTDNGGGSAETKPPRAAKGISSPTTPGPSPDRDDHGRD